MRYASIHLARLTSIEDNIEDTLKYLWLRSLMMVRDFKTKHHVKKKDTDESKFIKSFFADSDVLHNLTAQQNSQNENQSDDDVNEDLNDLNLDAIQKERNEFLSNHLTSEMNDEDTEWEDIQDDFISVEKTELCVNFHKDMCDNNAKYKCMDCTDSKNTIYLLCGDCKVYDPIHKNHKMKKLGDNNDPATSMEVKF